MQITCRAMVKRIWRREGLKIPQKQAKKGRLWLNDGSCVRLRPERPNHIWSYDFFQDRTHDGRLFRTLNIIDEYTRDPYQMNAYASRYHCKRLALVFPASRDCPPGKATEFVLMTEERPKLEVIAVDVRDLALGSGIPDDIDGVIPIERHWKQPASLAPICEAI